MSYSFDIIVIFNTRFFSLQFLLDVKWWNLPLIIAYITVAINVHPLIKLSVFLTHVLEDVMWPSDVKLLCGDFTSTPSAQSEWSI